MSDGYILGDDIERLMILSRWDDWEWFNDEYYIPYGISKEYYYEFLQREFYGEYAPKQRMIG